MKQIALFGAVATLPVQKLLAESTMKPIGDGRAAVPYGSEINRKKTPRKITIPDVGEYKVLKGDFHMHTLFSDGQVMPKDRVLEAVDNGLDAIAITDHIEYRPNIGGGTLKLADKNDDHNTPYNFAKGEAEKHKLILVRGAEITKSEWHFNALFVNDINPIAAVVNDWQAMLAVSVEQGGFVHWNHPGWLDRTPDAAPFGLKSGEPLRFFDEIKEAHAKGHLHGIEVFNGASFYPIVLDWCNEHDLAPLADSDIHDSEWNRYGNQNLMRPITLVFAKERSHDSLREAFFAKRIVGWAANMILGREPWVRELFRSCVTINKTASGLALQNRSDIPCFIEAGNKTWELPPQGTETIQGTLPQKLVVSNWFVGMNKPLEVPVQ